MSPIEQGQAAAGARRRLSRVGLLVVCLWLLHLPLATPAQAHPLGNFTVNHYSRVEVVGDVLAIRYVLDLAEIPSVQETRAADANGDGVVTSEEWDAYKDRKAAEISQQFDLRIDDQRVPLEPVDVTLSQPLGQGDIPLVRLEMWLYPTAPITANTQHQASLRDRSDPARLGWRELVVHAGRGATVTDADVPTQDVTDELRSYPDDLLQNPLDRREAQWSFSMDGSDAPASAPQAGTSTSRTADPFAALVTASDLNLAAVLFALLGAAALGGIHAASPGHGKSVMAAYIVGKQGTVVHALVLAGSVTVAHTSGVLVLGVLTVVAANLIVPDQLYPWLTLVSGAIVLLLGARFLVSALRRRDHVQRVHHHEHNDHQHGPADRPLGPTWRALLALGVSGGIVPSGSALVVLLSSVALGRLGFGLILIVAFGIGMGIVLVASGVLLVHTRRWLARLVPEADRARAAWAVPLASASLMTLLGVVATIQGLSQTGLLGP